VSLDRLADEMEHRQLALEREIVVMKLINHPNIMRLYDVWETSTELFLVLEYVQGGELFEHLCEKGRLPTLEALGYFQQIISAVDYCHRFNIAHRDLKPENILLGLDRSVKIADFGMAAWQKNAQDGMLFTSCGSPHYAAPEIIDGKPYNGNAADIWSCGVILYALLSGKLPFDDEDCSTLLEKVMIGEYDMPQGIDLLAQDLIRKMLVTDPRRRIPMVEIQNHPFYLLQKPNIHLHPIPSLGDIAQPIKSSSSIDPDIFANLRTLWHGSSDQEIIAALLNEEQNWQKGIYYLLSLYRRTNLGHPISAIEKKVERTPKCSGGSPVKSMPPQSDDDAARTNITNVAWQRLTPVTSRSSVDRFRPPVLIAPQLGDASFLAPLANFSHEDTVKSALQGEVSTPHQVRNALFVKPQTLKNDTPHLAIGNDKQSHKGQPHINACVAPSAQDHEPTRFQIRCPEQTSLSGAGDAKYGINVTALSLLPKSNRLSVTYASRKSLKQNWLTTVFKPKSTNYMLLSVEDVHTTRNECRRLIMEMGARVILRNPENLGILKCRLDRKQAGVARTMTKFRVEMHLPHGQGNDSCQVTLKVIRERGSHQLFKEVFDRLRDSWTFGEEGCRAFTRYVIPPVSFGGLFGDIPH
jgi:serine/threonine protein kinase